MDDNVYLEPQNSIDHDDHSDKVFVNGNLKNGEVQVWKSSHILDFSDLSIGELSLLIIWYSSLCWLLAHSYGI